MYGLPERHRADLKGARLIATPGCYVTAATLALAPLLDAGLIEPTGIIVDAASGVSGAGRVDDGDDRVLHRRRELRRLRAARPPPHPGDRAEPRRPGALHAPPGADEPGHPGDLLRPAGGRRRRRPTASLLDPLRQAYAGEPFVVVTDGRPSTKATLGSNTAHVTARYDERTGYVVALCALDNLTKGASGGALQSANVALGLDETAGLPQSASP